MTTNDRTRQKIQQQKELPTLSPNIQRILSACEDGDISQAALAGAGRVAYHRHAHSRSRQFRVFGQQGRGHSLNHAISVLGMVTVRSVSVGLTMSGLLRTDHCPRFQADHYWLSAVITAIGASMLNSGIASDRRPESDSIYTRQVLIFLSPKEADLNETLRVRPMPGWSPRNLQGIGAK